MSSSTEFQDPGESDSLSDHHEMKRLSWLDGGGKSFRMMFGLLSPSVRGLNTDLNPSRKIIT